MNSVVLSGPMDSLETSSPKRPVVYKIIPVTPFTAATIDAFDDTNIADLIATPSAVNMLVIFMRWEKNRLASFVKSPFEPNFRDDLVKSGIFWRGFNEKDGFIQCAFCLRTRRCSLKARSALSFHQNLNKQCRLLKGLECGNALRVGSQPTVGQHIRNLYTLTPIRTQMQSNDKQFETPDNLGLVMQRPACENFGTMAARFGTFDKFPKDCPIKPIKLCEAGFYYLGVADVVKCFYCEGMVEKWSAEDDPWMVHACHFTNCQFVKSMKGKRYCEYVMKNRKCPPDESLLPRSDDLDDNLGKCLDCGDDYASAVGLRCGCLILCTACANKGIPDNKSCPMCKTELIGSISLIFIES